jgi:pimeloyl-ACP methyl ester carboxylesterase
MTFMIGEDTMPLLARCHDRLTGAAPQARTIKVPGACHLIPWQQPEAVVSAVRSAIRA